MSGASKKLMQAAGAGVETDEFFNQTTLLLHGDGTNGGQNNTFLDSSTNNFTITRNGNTTQGSFSPYGDRWSNYFDGTGDFLSFSGITFNGDFCAECWFYKTANPASYTVIFGGSQHVGVPNANNHQFFVGNTGGIGMVLNATSIIADTGTAAAINQWNHIAWVRQGTGSNNCAIFVNGVRQATGTSTDNTSICSRIGTISSLTTYFPAGYISDARIVIGSTPYDPASTTITPPTAPLTAVSGTELLTCQSNGFKDNSANNFAITRNGDVKVTTFSPYAPSSAYDPAVDGGSGYFDGTGDYLANLSNDLIGPTVSTFTAEAWVYLTANPTAANNQGAIVGFATQPGGTINYMSFGALSGRTLALYWFDGAQKSATGSTVLNLHQWHHVACVVNSGAIQFYVDGVADSMGGTTTLTNRNGTQTNFTVGAHFTGATTGYISDLRVVDGTAIYTSAFTPPTAPLTAVSGTELLCNFTNAAIFDSTAKNVLETVGNAQIDTAVVKYGTGSMEFDGTGDYLTPPNNPDLAFGTGDFTIESWVYDNPTGSYHYIYDSRTSVNDTAGITIVARHAGVAGEILVYSNGTLITGTHPESAFYHMALTRSGSDLKLFVNGVQTGSTATYTGNLTNTNLKIGAGQANDFFMNGYLSDYRITKGVARYTANFTPPNRAFPDQ